MTKIGIIAGDGNLPLYIGKSLLTFLPERIKFDSVFFFFAKYAK